MRSSAAMRASNRSARSATAGTILSVLKRKGALARPSNDRYSIDQITSFLAEGVLHRGAIDPWLGQEVVPEKARRIRGHVHAGNVVLILQIPTPQPTFPTAIGGYERQRRVVLIPRVDLVA